MRERNDRGNSGPFSEERIVPGTGTLMTMSTLRRRSVIGVELLELAILGERPESAHLRLCRAAARRSAHPKG
jgi:hypothetical protein